MPKIKKIDLFNKKKIAELNKELARYSEALTERETKCRGLEKRVNDLNRIIDNTMNENKKLIEWIMNILKEFGTTEARDNNHIEIPVHRTVGHFYDYPKGRLFHRRKNRNTCNYNSKNEVTNNVRYNVVCQQ